MKFQIAYNKGKRASTSIRNVWSEKLIVKNESIWSILNKYTYINRPTYEEWEKIVDNSTSNSCVNPLVKVGLYKNLIRFLKKELNASLLNTRVIKSQLSLFEPIVTDHLRFCPLCLELGFHTVYFQDLRNDFCPMHSCALENKCPSCQSRIEVKINKRTITNGYRCSKCRLLLSSRFHIFNPTANLFDLKSSEELDMYTMSTIKFRKREFIYLPSPNGFSNLCAPRREPINFDTFVKDCALKVNKKYKKVKPRLFNERLVKLWLRFFRRKKEVLKSLTQLDIKLDDIKLGLKFFCDYSNSYWRQEKLGYEYRSREETIEWYISDLCVRSSVYDCLFTGPYHVNKNRDYVEMGRNTYFFLYESYKMYLVGYAIECIAHAHFSNKFSYAPLTSSMIWKGQFIPSCIIERKRNGELTFYYQFERLDFAQPLSLKTYEQCVKQAKYLKEALERVPF